MCKFNQSRGAVWEHWYFELDKLAQSLGVSVADEDAWRGSFEDDQTPEEALFEEYPELSPQKAAPKQHTSPCRECPWKRNSAPGWLGASEPGEFLAQSDTGHRMPCHLAGIDYESPNWKAMADKAPECAGHAIYLANRCKLPQPGHLKLPSDHALVFTRPHEFVAHHAGVDPKSLETTLIYQLYDVTRAPRVRKPATRKPAAQKRAKATA